MGIVIDPEGLHPIEVEGCTFQVKALTGRQVLKLSSALGNAGQDSDAIYEVLHTVVKSWDGVTNPKGKAVACSKKNIDQLPLQVAVKLFEFVGTLSGLSGDDVGN